MPSVSLETPNSDLDTTPGFPVSSVQKTEVIATPSPSRSIRTSTPISPTPEENSYTGYDLEVNLDYAEHLLSVKEIIIFTNSTQTTFPSIPLIIEPNRFPNTFQLDSMSMLDGLRVTNYQLKDRRLTINLSNPLDPGEKLGLVISYRLRLPNTSKLVNIRPYPFGYTYLQVNLGDWYPFIPPYLSGKGWIIHEPALYGEHLVYEIAHFNVNIRITGKITDLVIAASAPAEVSGEWRHYFHPAARTFAWSVSPHYQVVTQTVELPGSPSITVLSYHFPFYQEAGARVADTLSKAVSLYPDLFGVGYTHSYLSAVQADFLDGMEYDSLFFLSKDFYNWYNGTDQGFLVALTAHETAHQWFYGLVGNDQALKPWLDEALCTYSERLFYEHFYPEALDWWWTYRINYYNPSGWIDMTIYDAPQTPGQYRSYRDAVYLNGALFLEELRNVVGDQTFFGALRAYLAQHIYQLGDSESFFLIFNQHTGKDLDALICKYFLHLIPCP